MTGTNSSAAEESVDKPGVAQPDIKIVANARAHVVRQ